MRRKAIETISKAIVLVQVTATFGILLCGALFWLSLFFDSFTLKDPSSADELVRYNVASGHLNVALLLTPFVTFLLLMAVFAPLEKLREWIQIFQPQVRDTRKTTIGNKEVGWYKTSRVLCPVQSGLLRPRRGPGQIKLSYWAFPDNSN